jgi:hypothetical protein
MLHYWLTVVITAFHNTFGFIGKSKGGFLFDVCVVLLAVYRLYRKYGWQGMKKKVWETVIEGVVIAAIAGMIVFAWEFINAPVEMQTATEQKVTGEHTGAIQARSDWVTCKGDLSTQTVKADLLGGQRDAQQVTINNQQSQLNAQQGTMNSCVVNLGKLNPLINTKTGVVAIQVATETKPPTVRLGSPVITYWYAIVLSANRRINFSGRLKCSNSFKATAPQVTLREATSGFFGGGSAIPVSDREYILTNSDTGGVWDAADPVYLVATSSEKDLGPCTFTLPR